MDPWAEPVSRAGSQPRRATTLPQTGRRELECSPGWLLGTAYESNRSCALGFLQITGVSRSLQAILLSSRVWAGSWGSPFLLPLPPASPVACAAHMGGQRGAPHQCLSLCGREPPSLAAKGEGVLWRGGAGRHSPALHAQKRNGGQRAGVAAPHYHECRQRRMGLGLGSAL